MSRLSRIAAAALAAASLAALTLPATAEEVATSRPLAAASLHEGPLDMVAYFIEGEGDVYEVTATFAPRAAPYAEPMRVVMALRDGDKARFAMPGFRGATYAFARAGDRVTYGVESWERTASAE